MNPSELLLKQFLWQRRNEARRANGDVATKTKAGFA